MKLTFELYLREEQLRQETVIVYPGRFQPAHKNHAKVYNFLVKHFPYASVFVATSNKISLPKSPFTFDEKKIMLTAAGVPAEAIIQTTNPYVAKEITQNFNPENTRLIFAVGGKDMVDKKPRFNFLPTKKGDAYFKPLPKLQLLTFNIVNTLFTFNNHGYVATTPTYTFNINILGQKINIKGASDIRELYKKASEAGKRDIIIQLYGSFNEEIFDLFNKRLI